jgi:hypothetical protein
MRVAPFVSAVTAVAFLSASMPVAAQAQSASIQSPATFRASIDRAASQAVAQPPARQPRPVRKAAQMMPGGGGGGGMMLMTLLVTAASLAGTYFLVKEMKKSTDEAKAQ